MPAWYDTLQNAFTFDNVPLLISAAVTFIIGFLEYIWSFKLIRREGMAPYPVWMHTFYFAHDSSWAVIMLLAGARTGYWFFWVVGIALIVWNLFEVYNIYKVITVERQEIFGDYVKDQVTVRQAVVFIIIQLFAMYMLVNILISFMGPGSIMQWFLFTNMLIASAPGVLWLRRGVTNGTRRGTSLGLGIIILAGTINTFLPGANMWVLSMPQVFATPIFYLTGVVFVAIAGWNLYNLTRLQAVAPTEEYPRPVW